MRERGREEEREEEEEVKRRGLCLKQNVTEKFVHGDVRDAMSTSCVSEACDEFVGLLRGWRGACGCAGAPWWSVTAAGEATLRSRSTAEMREDESERLPFLSKSALKLSLLVDL